MTTTAMDDTKSVWVCRVHVQQHITHHQILITSSIIFRRLSNFICSDNGGEYIVFRFSDICWVEYRHTEQMHCKLMWKKMAIKTKSCQEWRSRELGICLIEYDLRVWLIGLECTLSLLIEVEWRVVRIDICHASPFKQQQCCHWMHYLLRTVDVDAVDVELISLRKFAN